MPTLDLTKKKLRYFSSDIAAIEKAAALANHMAEYDEAAKQDAGTAKVALGHLLAHVKKQRNGTTEQK
jgi:hypothetical protein